MQSLSDRNRRKTLERKRFLLIFVSVCLVLSWTFLRPAFLTVFDPLLSLYGKTTSFIFLNLEKTKTFFTSKEELLAYTKELEEENSQLQNRVSLYENSKCHQETIVEKQEDKNEIVSLVSTSTASTTTKILDSEEKYDPCLFSRMEIAENTITIRASPLLSGISYLFDTIRLNKGEVDGVHEGDVVYTRGMIAIGKVHSVTKSSSLVLLYSKDKNETFGTISESDTSFKVIGVGGGSYVALVPREVNIEEGKTVLLTEDQTFSLGKVVSVVFNKEDVSKKVFIKGGFNPAQLSVYYITIHE
jgi:cell shape-determining protein MreC